MIGRTCASSTMTERGSAECWWFVDGNPKWQQFELHTLKKIDLQARAIGQLR